MNRYVVALFCMLLFVAALPVNVQGQPTSTLTEDFEDDAFLDPPESEWYTWGTNGGQSYVDTSNPNNGTLAWRSNGEESAQEHSYLQLTESRNICTAEQIDFSIAFALGGTPERRFSVDSGNQPLSSTGWIGFLVQNTGAVEIKVRSSTGQDATTGASFVTLANNEYLNVSIRDINCPSASFRIVLPDEAQSITLNAAGSIDSLSYLMMDPADDQWIYLDDVVITDIEDGTPEAVAADDTVSVDALLSFDVDQTGATLIARHSAGANVSTYSATSLQLAATTDTTCAQFDGIAVSRTGTHVAYINCDAGDPDAIRIRAANLGSPVPPEGCGFAPDALDIDIDSDLENAQQITALDGFDLDYSNCDTVLQNEVQMVFGFSTFDGKVGAYAELMQNNFPDESEIAVAVLDATASPQVNSLCAYRDTDTNDLHLVGATLNGASRVWEVDVQVTGWEVSLNEIAVGTGAFGNGRAVDCGGNRVLMGNDDTVTLGNRLFAATLPSYTLTAAGDRQGVALSGSGDWGAFYDDGVIKVFNASSGAEVAYLTAPTGDLREMHMDFNAQNLWAANATEIHRWTIHTYTTGVQVGNPLEDIGGADDSGSSGGAGGLQGLFDDQISNNAGFFGGENQARAFTGWILIIFGSIISAALCGLVAWYSTESFATAARIKWTTIAAVAGLVVGLIISLSMGVAFNVVDSWVPVAIIIVCAAIIALVLAFLFGRR